MSPAPRSVMKVSFVALLALVVCCASAEEKTKVEKKEDVEGRSGILLSGIGPVISPAVVDAIPVVIEVAHAAPVDAGHVVLGPGLINRGLGAGAGVGILKPVVTATGSAVGGGGLVGGPVGVGSYGAGYGLQGVVRPALVRPVVLSAGGYGLGSSGVHPATIGTGIYGVGYGLGGGLGKELTGAAAGPGVGFQGDGLNGGFGGGIGDGIYRTDHGSSVTGGQSGFHRGGSGYNQGSQGVSSGETVHTVQGYSHQSGYSRTSGFSESHSKSFGSGQNVGSSGFFGGAGGYQGGFGKNTHGSTGGYGVH